MTLTISFFKTEMIYLAKSILTQVYAKQARAAIILFTWISVFIGSLFVICKKIIIKSMQYTIMHNTTANNNTHSIL